MSTEARPCPPVPEPPRAIEGTAVPPAAALLPLRAALEELLALSRLRGCAAAALSVPPDAPPSAAPAALLAHMDDRLTLSVSYLAALPPVRAAFPAGWGGAGLLLAAARASPRLVVHAAASGEARVGVSPPAAPRARCTLLLRGADARLTLGDVQRLVPRHAVLRWCRPAPDAVLVTFEDAQTAKGAFVELQGKPLGGAQVRMRVGADAPLETRAQTSRQKGERPTPVPPIGAFVPAKGRPPLGRSGAKPNRTGWTGWTGWTRAEGEMERMRREMYALALREQMVLAARAFGRQWEAPPMPIDAPTPQPVRRCLQHDPYRTSLCVEVSATGRHEWGRCKARPPPQLGQWEGGEGKPTPQAASWTEPWTGTSTWEDGERSPAFLTPNETSSNTPSVGSDGSGTQQITYADVIRAAHVPECTVQGA